MSDDGNSRIEFPDTVVKIWINKKRNAQQGKFAQQLRTRATCLLHREELVGVHVPHLLQTQWAHIGTCSLNLCIALIQAYEYKALVNAALLEVNLLVQVRLFQEQLAPV